jgi:2OG-Fe(II) oxygenase superfamily
MTSRRLKLLVIITSGVVSIPCALAFKSSELFPTLRSWQRLPGQEDRRHVVLRTTRLSSTNKVRKNGIRRNRHGKTGTTRHGGFSTRIDPIADPSTKIRIRALRQLCDAPLIFSIDDFVTAETCAELLQNNDQERAEEARLQFATLVASELFAGQWGVNDGLRYNTASSSDANNDISELSSLPEGLHVDTNNNSIFRSVTVILYLNDVAAECGGATVFPLANAKDHNPVLTAARRLMVDQIAHTRGAAGSTGVMVSHEADASLLEGSVADTERGLRIQPQAGRLCIFFSRDAHGEIDPRSWHGGERLRNNVGNVATDKHILTLFKEVYYGTLRPETYDTSFEQYLAPQIAEQRTALQHLAQTHAGCFVST